MVTGKRDVTTNQWVPGNAYERTDTMPDDCPQTPSDTGQGWVPVEEDRNLSGYLSIF